MRNMILPVMDIESPYFYNGYTVPRVNSILSSMINEDYIPKWANSLGFRKQSYEETLQLAADKGTYTHDKIDKYIKGEDISNFYIPDNCKKAVDNTFSAFLNWWNIVNSNNKVSVIMNETALSCNLFGGTMDLFIEINDHKYLVDFKTSNQPSYRYHLQLSAYEYLLEFNYRYNVDGWIILLLNKYRPIFNEFLIKRPENSIYMDNCKNTFLLLTESYYNKLEVEHESLQFFQ